MNIFSLPALQRDRHVLYSCKSHVVLCPKDRRKVPVNGADKRLQEIIDPVAPALGSEVMERDVVPDHIHLLRSRWMCECMHVRSVVWSWIETKMRDQYFEARTRVSGL